MNTTKKTVDRQAIEDRMYARKLTNTELAKRLGLIGRAKHLPADLSTNTAQMDGFTKPK